MKKNKLIKDILILLALLVLMIASVTGVINPDTNGDGCVDLNEIITYIDLWKQGQVTLQEVINAIDWWKQGCGTTTTTIGTTTTTSSTTTTSIPGQGFRFIAWADTKSAKSSLSALSNQAVQLNPVFTIYPGDLESSGFTTSGMNSWKNAMNGNSNNGMFDKTFSVRGNHDSNDAPGWQSYYNFGQMANSVGATNYAEMSADLTYSFDYGNSHFVGIDVTGSVGGLSDSEASWLDNDLTAAENRGLTHAFLFWHGPIYCVDGHCSCSQRLGCNPPARVTNVLNNHPIVTATFHGHEHVYAYTYIDSSRIPSITHPFHQFVVGDAGAGVDSCNSNRCEYNMPHHGFITVDVNGNDFVVTWYKQGSMSPQHTMSFRK